MQRDCKISFYIEVGRSENSSKVTGSFIHSKEDDDEGHEISVNRYCMF